MIIRFFVAAAAGALLFSYEVTAQNITSPKNGLEYIGKSVRGVPVSPAVRVGRTLLVSGTPGFGEGGKLASDFSGQMKQAMENITALLKSADAGWERVGKVTVYLTRREDFGEMNRIYASYFPDARYPARTTLVVSALPQPDFFVEIECEAFLE
jgi:enamine deaminase RidA (YjgF/YER057c/UK114 family)